MIGWNDFIWFALSAVLCWMLGAFLGWKNSRKAIVVSLVGTAVFLCFIIGLWITLERPPMRTQGETRLWYSFFISLIGVLVYSRWKFRWILSFSTMMAIVFTCINIFKGFV